jgi:hypothetical protein
MELDKETQQLSLRASKFSSLISHPHWGDAKKELLDELATMNSVASVDLTIPPEKIVENIKLVRELTRIVYNWIGTIETTGSFSIPKDEGQQIIVTRD